MDKIDRLCAAIMAQMNEAGLSKLVLYAEDYNGTGGLADDYEKFDPDCDPDFELSNIDWDNVEFYDQCSIDLYGCLREVNFNGDFAYDFIRKIRCEGSSLLFDVEVVNRVSNDERSTVEYTMGLTVAELVEEYSLELVEKHLSQIVDTFRSPERRRVNIVELNKQR